MFLKVVTHRKYIAHQIKKIKNINKQQHTCDFVYKRKSLTSVQTRVHSLDVKLSSELVNATIIPFCESLHIHLYIRFHITAEQVDIHKHLACTTPTWRLKKQSNVIIIGDVETLHVVFYCRSTIGGQNALNKASQFPNTCSIYTQAYQLVLQIVKPKCDFIVQ